jgi:hypothetical protein
MTPRADRFHPALRRRVRVLGARPPEARPPAEDGYNG